MHIWFGRPSSAQGRIPRGAAASLRACAVLLHPIPSPSSPTGSQWECVPWSTSSCDDYDSSGPDEDAWVETAGQACQLRAGGQSWGATTVMGPDGSLVHEAGNWLARLDAAHNKTFSNHFLKRSRLSTKLLPLSPSVCRCVLYCNCHKKPLIYRSGKRKGRRAHLCSPGVKIIADVKKNFLYIQVKETKRAARTPLLSLLSSVSKALAWVCVPNVLQMCS